MILMFDSVGWINDILRTLAGGVDWLIYSLISWVLEGIFNLSSLTASATLVDVIYKRVFTILIIFMVFKLSFSFIQYLINPDAMTDREKGVAKVISRSIVMLAMLILVPILFFSTDLVGKNEPILTTLQNGVIRTLPKLVLGISQDNTRNFSQSAADTGKMLSGNMLNAFYYEKNCKDSTEATCGTPVQLGTFLSTIKTVDGAEYQYYYMWPLTLIAGILMVFILLGFAIDVAIRTFKLIILEMIAPVPIMSYIDPKSSKDGAFASWLKTFTSTYIDIFIKLGSIYILLLLISKMFDFSNSGLFGNQLSNLSFMARNFVVVFLAIGLLKFAKDAPKFIKDALGIKDSGGGGIFGGLKALGAATGAVAGGAAGLVGGFAGGVASAKAAGQGGFMGAMKGIGGGVAGAFRGTAQGAKGAAKGNPLKGVSGALQAQNAITKRKIETAGMGSTWGGRMVARGEEFLTGQTAADRDKEQMDEYKEAIDGAKGFKSVLADSAGKSDAIIGGTNLKQFKADVEAAKSGDAAALSRLKSYGFSKKVTTTASNGAKVSTTVGDLSAAIAGSAKFEKDWQKSYYNEVSAGRITDGDAQAVISAKSVADAGIRGLDLHDSTGAAINEVNADNAGMVIGIATSESNKIASSTKYKSNKANAEAIKRGK